MITIEVLIRFLRNSVFLLIIVIMLSATFPLPACGSLLVNPTEISLGKVNASCSPVTELPGGISIFCNNDSGESALFSVVLAQPLIHKATGKLLSANQVLIGSEILQPISESTTLPAPVQGFFTLKVAVRLHPFDAPGLYEGIIQIATSGSTVDLPITIEALPWASVKLAVPEAAFKSNGEPPGSEAFVATGKNAILWVASNTHWKLIMSQGRNLSAQTAREESIIPISELTLKIFEADYVFPAYEGYVNFGQYPMELAHGMPTGQYGDGWVPIIADLELPFTRNQSAGYYSGSLGFEVCPQQ